MDWRMKGTGWGGEVTLTMTTVTDMTDKQDSQKQDSDRYDSNYDILTLGLDNDSDLDSNDKGDDSENNNMPRHDGAEFSFPWSHRDNFILDLQLFSYHRSCVTGDWPCGEEAREIDYSRAFFDHEVMAFLVD